MIKKGIILSGGKGTRMSPLTKAVNKQLLPIYDKPLIFYSLSVLMLAKIKDIKIKYIEQNSPKGLPDAFILGEKFIGKDNVSLILGDNFFYGKYLTKKLLDCIKLNTGAKVFLHKVSNPERYGVAKIKKNKITSIKEKPKKFVSNLAITGLYFFDNKVIKYSKKLKPSKRKELEITDLLIKYQKKNQLYADYIGKDGTWLDTGSIKDFYKTNNFVSDIESKKNFKIACIEEIALLNKWINRKNILN